MTNKERPSENRIDTISVPYKGDVSISVRGSKRIIYKTIGMMPRLHGLIWGKDLVVGRKVWGSTSGEGVEEGGGGCSQARRPAEKC